MKLYTFYNLETGSINRKAFLQDDMVEANLVSGEGYLEGAYDADTQKIVDGAAVNIDQGVIDTQINDAAWANIRETRNALLAETDWTQAADSPLTDTQKQSYRLYRQNLRDLPQADGFDPLNPEWPTLP